MTVTHPWDALADSTRREIVQRLAQDDLTAGEIADFFHIARPGVSRHLRVLREAGVVEARADGQRRIYTLRPESIQSIEQWCAEVTSFWTARLDALDAHIAQGKGKSRARKKGKP